MATTKPNPRKPGRPKGSTNKVKFPLDDKQIKTIYKDKELDRLKSLVERQDNMIAQLQDELIWERKEVEKLNQDIDLLEGNLDSFRTILITILEMDK